MSYRTLARRAVHEDVVMGSRFLTWVAPVADVRAAEALLDEARRAHPTASHHCWAFRVGTEQRFSDDGEPGGTAGRPMLEVFLKRDLDRVGAVVVRYFGGRKLGAGGLARAYGSGVAHAIRKAGERLVEARQRLLVRAPFPQVDAVLRSLHEARGAIRQEPQYDAAGLRVIVTLPENEAATLEAGLAEITRGEASIERLPDGGRDEEG